MNKLIKLVFFLFIFVNLFLISDQITDCIKLSCEIWFSSLIPSMLPIYIASDLLINYGFVDFLAIIFKPFVNKLFGLSGNASFVVFFSMLTGFPSSAKYIKNLLEKNLIDITEANKLIRFTHFSNPLFIVNTIGSFIVNDKTLGIFILISHYLSNFIIGFIFRKELINSYKIVEKQDEKTLSETLTKSFLESFNSLLIVLGSLITFQILTKILYFYFDFNTYLKIIIESTLEITQGLFELRALPISSNIKAIIATAIISFGGLCIHMQMSSILSDTKIKYKNYLFGRLIQILLAPIILIIILLFTNRI